MRAAAFERCASEEAAVEKWNAAEGAGRCGACAGRRIESAEEEGQEDSAVVVAAAFHAAGERIVEESPIVIQPAFGLDEAEEEESGDVEQSEIRAFGW
ncbi:MAG TPA: hypothetical protein VGR59_00755 [Gemmatimonadaceae bacterium]|nr:hypothetical protein [Gemmatimonadaceae bacterium]